MCAEVEQEKPRLTSVGKEGCPPFPPRVDVNRKYMVYSIGYFFFLM